MYIECFAKLIFLAFINIIQKCELTYQQIICLVQNKGRPLWHCLLIEEQDEVLFKICSKYLKISKLVTLIIAIQIEIQLEIELQIQI